MPKVHVTKLNNMESSYIFQTCAYYKRTLIWLIKTEWLFKIE